MGIHHQDLARADPALGNDVFAPVAVGSHFRRECYETVAGGNPAGRAQAIAIEQADGVPTVRKNDAGRSIPGLHVHGVVLVERLQVGVNGLDILPCRGNQHAQRPRHIHAAGEQQVQHIVQAGRVRAGAVYQWCDILDIGQPVSLESRRARVGPVAVTLDGIDLTVVGQQAEGLRQRPARHGIGRKALVKYTDRRLQPCVSQIQVKPRQINRHDQAFVGDYPAGQAADIEITVLSIGDLRLASRHKQFRAEFLPGDARSVYKYLFDRRQAGQCNVATD